LNRINNYIVLLFIVLKTFITNVSREVFVLQGKLSGGVF